MAFWCFVNSCFCFLKGLIKVFLVKEPIPVVLKRLPLNLRQSAHCFLHIPMKASFTTTNRAGEIQGFRRIHPTWSLYQKSFFETLP